MQRWVGLRYLDADLEEPGLMEPLKLAAFDGEDLAVISALSAGRRGMKVGDLAYLPDQRSLRPGRASRFDWEAATMQSRPERRR